MNTFEKTLEDIFDVTPQIVPVEQSVTANSTDIVTIVPGIEITLDTDLRDDYQKSRENLQDIITQGKDAMDEILKIAKESETPRAFEVYGGILKNVVEANKELILMQKQMREMDAKKSTNNTNIDKAVFVGTTKELQDFLGGKVVNE